MTITPQKKVIDIEKNSIITSAVKFHIDGNIEKAEKLYRYIIKNKFANEIIYWNYAAIDIFKIDKRYQYLFNKK